ncbi:MAG: hypothetical protein EZS28_019839 [Streblomastix strix]|uniref:Tyr recombinase domain-containing protein n=1 Tax=Streblomastix strix TaxID=222440 RepID=A0A5J4VPZ2_9EUKA|nr:MAG: hypothetical protein EZS28_019839 [Streblomastix strix]
MTYCVNKTENQASPRLALKQANAIETYEDYETDNEKLSYSKPTTTKDISLQLIKLLRELKIIGASAYSIRHSATIELAKLGIPESDLAIFTYHSKNSRTVDQYYIFASSIRANEIASPPKICILTRGEIKIRRKFPRELKDRTGEMMLKVGWSAWNDNAEIRTLPCQGLITDYRQRDVINKLHRRI